MKNIELLSICQDYFNRFINGNELVKRLENMDKTNMNDAELLEVNKMVEDIKRILAETPNEIDELVIREQEDKKKITEIINKIPDDIEGLSEKVKNNNDENKEKDSKERWFKISDYINNNDYFEKLFSSLDDYELLELIADKIKLRVPPEMNQDKFERLVKAGIEKDEREWLWRLAFSYEDMDINFDSIVDYYIKVNDGYYLAELISVIGDSLNIDSLIDKINNPDLIKDLEKRKYVIDTYFSVEQKNKLLNKLEE